MTSGRIKTKAPLRVRAATKVTPTKVSRPKKSPASLVSSAGATSAAPLFTAKELDKFDVLMTEPDFVMVRCGVTSHRYGDYGGTMKIYRDGRVKITCECYEGCPADNMSMAEFGDHTKPPVGESQWGPGALWTRGKDGDKIFLKRSGLLKYFKGSPNDPSTKMKPRENPKHRDEFVQCTKCNKHRRFALASQDEAESREACRIYHDVSLKKNWICADYPDQKYSCDDIEERATRMNFRGCPKSPSCTGCSSCVCLGCYWCCFEDCECRICVDFITNAGTQDSNGL